MAGSPIVLVLGSVNVDHVAVVDRLPDPGETVAAGSYSTNPGGKGLNQAVAAARLGAEVRFVAAVGGDAAGDEMLALLDRERIDRRWVARSEAPTGTALIVVDAVGENMIAVAAGANGSELSLAALTEALTGEVGVVLCQLEVPLAAVERALTLGRARGAVTMLNAAPAAAPLSDDLLALVDLLVVNRAEAHALSGEPDPRVAATALGERGPATVIVTLGERGGIVARHEGTIDYAARPVDAVDGTAAGDAFCGALAAGLAAGGTVVDALEEASAAGALAAGIAGAVPSLPTRAELERTMGASR